VLRVYGDFMGCVVDAGQHEVQFRFLPRSFAIGRWASLAGIGLCCVALAGAPERPRSAEEARAGRYIATDAGR